MNSWFLFFNVTNRLKVNKILTYVKLINNSSRTIFTHYNNFKKKPPHTKWQIKNWISVECRKIEVDLKKGTLRKDVFHLLALNNSSDFLLDFQTVRATFLSFLNNGKRQCWKASVAWRTTDTKSGKDTRRLNVIREVINSTRSKDKNVFPLVCAWQ